MSNQSDLAKSAAGFNGDPLSIDTANNRVGVGTVSPSATLDVNGTIKLDGNYPVGTGNVALGDAAMNGSISGNYNTALGDYSMQPMTSGASNTGVGGSALRFVTSGSYNTAVGHQSLHSNTTASNNTAVGYQAGYSGTTASDLTAIGYIAGKDVTTGGSNTFVGAYAGENITSANANTVVGRTALRYATTNGSNTAVGSDALELTTGAGNTAIGQGSGSLITIGSQNTILGRFNGNQGGLDIRTNNDNIVLSDGNGNPRGRFDGNGKFHTRSANDQGIEIRIGSTTSTNGKALDFVDGDGNQCGYVLINASANTVSYQTSSDGSKKTNYRAIDNPTDRVKALNPLKFDWISDGSTSEGFIAQEIKRDTQLGLDCVDGEEGSMTMDYSRVTPLLTAALKEAITKIEQLETENTGIKARLDALEGS